MASGRTFIFLALLAVQPAIHAVSAQTFIPQDWVLLAHYPLSTNGDDTTGNSVAMSLTNVEFTADGAAFNGRYIGTDPSGSNALTPDFPAMDLEAFAVTARFKAEEAFDGPVFVVGSSWRSAGVWLEPDSSLHAYTNGSRDVQPEAAYQPGIFYDVGILYDGATDTLTVFLDDVAVLRSGRELITGDDRNVTVTDGGSGTSFFGVLSDLRIYSRDQSVTASEPVDIPQHSPARLEIYPNPITNQSTILFESESVAGVSIDLHDILGRTVLASVQLASGHHGQIRHQMPSGLPPGVYIATADQQGVVTTTTFIVTQ